LLILIQSTGQNIQAKINKGEVMKKLLQFLMIILCLSSALASEQIQDRNDMIIKTVDTILDEQKKIAMELMELNESETSIDCVIRSIVLCHTGNRAESDCLPR